VRDVHCSLNVDTITDIFLGRHTPVLKHSDARDLEDTRLLSVIAGDQQLDLMAESARQRTQWTMGLVEVLKRERDVTTSKVPLKSAII